MRKRQIFKGQTLVLLTKHQKERVIAPLLEQTTGGKVVVESGFDTDQFGTFSRERARPESQLATARLKIAKGLELCPADIGLASEGSFGPHPLMPIPWNIEMVLLKDKKENIEVCGIYQGAETNFNQILTGDYDQVLAFAGKARFPEHHLIMRPDSKLSTKIVKDISSYDHLEQAFNWCVSQSSVGQVFLETDMRAHANPTRMNNIEKATEDLLAKLYVFCPDCGAPAFAVSQRIQGLPCELCALPSKMILKQIRKCSKCGFIQEELHPDGGKAPAKYCDFCNP